MAMVLVKQGDEIYLTNEYDLLEELMEKWDGAGLPDEAYYRRHFHGEALNGILKYKPEEGGFLFSYKGSRIRLAYQYMETCIRRLQDKKDRFDERDMVWALRVLYAGKLIGKEERQALEHAFC